MLDIEISNIPTITYDGIDLSATVYQHMNVAPDKILFYFHGGGLIYGDKEDLPDAYIRLLTNAGFLLTSLDYPLAPEMKLPHIVGACVKQVEYFLSHRFSDEPFNLPATDDYFLMGRSAGAFLALQVAHRIEKKPKGLGLFYGYYNLQDAQFKFPSRHYQNIKAISDDQAKKMIKNKAFTRGSLPDRYPLYLYSRQTGKWMDLLTNNDKDSLDQFSLNNEDLELLPPAYIISADQDPDVPTRQSRMMANHIPNSQLVIVKSDEHDFDRTKVVELGIPAYENMINFFDRL